ncbi:chorismate-binding protein, partial [Nocardia abscessus]|uniref:chorismate-binding protein n=1 Tax=Nocardia abscessus TaxID=120957 RepID=UPI0024588092
APPPLRPVHTPPPAGPAGGFWGAPGGGGYPPAHGAWVVAIRCAELAADGRTVRAYAGGGIVAASDPQAELDETTAKLRTLLGALHCDLPPR